MFAWLKRLFSCWRQPAVAAPKPGIAPLQRIRLADGVARTLLEDFAEHRDTERGDEEIGWVLLGLRQGADAIALAALPAGASRDAGAAHVRFNALAQAVASRIVRQRDKRLQIIGVVHTHPGSLRVPSDGDWHGDSQWVANLRGGEGVFAIGTADVRGNEPLAVNRQIDGELCFSWYALAAGERRYRPLPVDVVPGLDLAQPVRCVWDIIEANADAIEHLCRQFAKVEFDVLDDEPEPMLAVKIALAGANQRIRLLLNTAEARYYWERGGDIVAIDPAEPNLVRAVFLILAELQRENAHAPVSTLVES